MYRITGHYPPNLGRNLDRQSDCRYRARTAVRLTAGGRQALASPDLSSGLMAGAGGSRAAFWTWILVLGYDDNPAGGPGAGVPRGPWGCPSWSLGRVRAGQGACGSASMRCQAAAIAAAQGQVAWIFRRRRRPRRTSRAAACRTRSVLGSALARSPSRASSQARYPWGPTKRRDSRSAYGMRRAILRPATREQNWAIGASTRWLNSPAWRVRIRRYAWFESFSTGLFATVRYSQHGTGAADE
jgi:hypothetical protein